MEKYLLSIIFSYQLPKFCKQSFSFLGFSHTKKENMSCFIHPLKKRSNRKNAPEAKACSGGEFSRAHPMNPLIAFCFSKCVIT